MYNIEIDKESGFCFGVTTAIRKAEEELSKGTPLYCLGDIVHNGQECERLKAMGLVTINHEEYAKLKNVKVLLRAHGEPPETYRIAAENNIEIAFPQMDVHLKRDPAPRPAIRRPAQSLPSRRMRPARTRRAPTRQVL